MIAKQLKNVERELLAGFPESFEVKIYKNRDALPVSLQSAPDDLEVGAVWIGGGGEQHTYVVGENDRVLPAGIRSQDAAIELSAGSEVKARFGLIGQRLRTIAASNQPTGQVN